MRELPLSDQHEGGFACHLLKDHLRDVGHRVFSFICTSLLCLLETRLRTGRRGSVNLTSKQISTGREVLEGGVQWSLYESHSGGYPATPAWFNQMSRLDWTTQASVWQQSRSPPPSVFIMYHALPVQVDSILLTVLRDIDQYSLDWCI